MDKNRASLLICLFLGISATSSSPLPNLDDVDSVGNEDEKLFLTRTPRAQLSPEGFSMGHLQKLVPENYSIHEPPPTNNEEPRDVDISILIMNVRDIKEKSEEISLEMNMRIYWKDTRLSHLADKSGKTYIVLNPVLLSKLWSPDIFIDHVKTVSQPQLISQPASLRIYPDYTIRYSGRITVSMACQMVFHFYPADTQRCNIDVKSYAYSNKIINLDWREGRGAVLVDYLDLPNFDVGLDSTQTFMVNTSSGSYTVLRFTILLRRKLSYHLIQTYLPSTLFIVVSWLSFLVPPESVPGRMAICMTTLLTLTAMFSSVRQSTPNVSYVKALDIWMVVCIVFVFLTLVEYTVILKLKSKKPKQKKSLEQVAPTQNRPSVPGEGDVPAISYRTFGQFPAMQLQRTKADNQPSYGSPSTPRSGSTDSGRPERIESQLALNVSKDKKEDTKNKYELAAKKLEKFTGVVIPALFIVFNFIYWPWLIESANYYHYPRLDPGY